MTTTCSRRGLRQFTRERWRGWHWRGFRAREFGAGLAKADVLARRDRGRAEIEGILETADAEMAADLRQDLWPVVRAYEAAKRRAGCLDFVDLLIRARDLVRDDATIRAHYRDRFSHFFVDEFQDTDPLQAEILLLLCGEDADETRAEHLLPARGKLFVVGDPKQSIYRFRRADVMLYERTKRRLADAGARVLHLSTSFRSQPRLQVAVNGAFEARIAAAADGSQAAYVPLAPHRPDLGGQPAVVALPVPRPYGERGTAWGRAVEASLPDAVGAFVHWLVRESEWTVTERERPHEPVPVEARHVCLLFRRFQAWGDDVTRPYVRALEARAIPHVLVGGRSYFDREEVLAVHNALTAIEWPDDRLSVYAALRGPLFSLGDGALFEFGAEVGPLHPLAGWGEGERAERVAGLAPELRAVAEVLDLLGELHRHRNRRLIADTILRLLDAARAHAGIAIWPTGEQALANVLRVVDRARAFERRGADSFRAFLDRLNQEAEGGQAEEAPIVEEGTEGVRMMTVHKAKGLEFPVVILADMTCPATHRMPTRHVDAGTRLWVQPLCGAVPLDLLNNADLERRRDGAEADRLAYVAATRARDLLVVPALGDGRDGKGGMTAGDDAWWLDALHQAVYPPLGTRRAPTSAEPPGCPAFGDDSVIERRDRQGRPRPRPRESVAPGLHASEAGTPVVWWDPAVLDLDVELPAAVRQKRLLDVEREVQPTLDVEAGRRAHEAWRDERAARQEAGGRPTVEVVTARAAAGATVEAGEPPPEVEVEWTAVPRPPEGGARRDGAPRRRALRHARAPSLGGDVAGRRHARGRPPRRGLGPPSREPRGRGRGGRRTRDARARPLRAATRPRGRRPTMRKRFGARFPSSLRHPTAASWRASRTWPSGRGVAPPRAGSLWTTRRIVAWRRRAPRMRRRSPTTPRPWRRPRAPPRGGSCLRSNASRSGVRPVLGAMEFGRAARPLVQAHAGAKPLSKSLQVGRIPAGDIAKRVVSQLPESNLEGGANALDPGQIVHLRGVAATGIAGLPTRDRRSGPRAPDGVASRIEPGEPGSELVPLGLQPARVLLRVGPGALEHPPRILLDGRHSIVELPPQGELPPRQAPPADPPPDRQAH